MSSCAVCGYIILESWGRNCCKNSQYRFSLSVGTWPEENPFCTATRACEGDWRLCLKKRSAESPEQPSGDVKLSLWGCNTFACPPAAACATDGPVAACGGRCFEPSSSPRPLTPFEGAEGASCLLQGMKAPASPVIEILRHVLIKLQHFCKELCDPEMLQAASLMCDKKYAGNSS